MKKARLFDIAEDIRTLDDILDDMDGDVTGSEDVVAMFFAENEIALAVKVEGYCQIIKERTAIAAARKEEAKRIADLAKTDENRVKWLKARLKETLESLDIKKLETATHKVSIANNGGVIPITWEENESMLEKFGTTQIVLLADGKARIRELLESGETVSGATLGERGTSLKIK